MPSAFHVKRYFCLSCFRSETDGFDRPCPYCGQALRQMQVLCLGCVEWRDASEKTCASCEATIAERSVEDFFPARLRRLKDNQRSGSAGFVREPSSPPEPEPVLIDRQKKLLESFLEELEALEPDLIYPGWRDRVETFLISRFPLSTDQEKWWAEHRIKRVGSRIDYLEDIRTRSALDIHRDLAWIALLKEKGLHVDGWEWLRATFPRFMKTFDDSRHQGGADVASSPIDQEIVFCLPHWRTAVPIHTAVHRPPREQLNWTIVARTLATYLDKPKPLNHWAAIGGRLASETVTPEQQTLLDEALVSADLDVRLSAALAVGEAKTLLENDPYKHDPKYAPLISVVGTSLDSWAAQFKNLQELPQIQKALDRLTDADWTPAIIKTVTERLVCEKNGVTRKKLFEKILPRLKDSKAREDLLLDVLKTDPTATAYIGQWLDQPGATLSSALAQRLQWEGKISWPDWIRQSKDVAHSRPYSVELFDYWLELEAPGNWRGDALHLMSRQMFERHDPVCYQKIIAIAFNMHKRPWDTPLRVQAFFQLAQAAGEEFNFAPLVPLRWDVTTISLYIRNVPAWIGALTRVLEDPAFIKDASIQDWWVDFWRPAQSNPPPFLGAMGVTADDSSALLAALLAAVTNPIYSLYARSSFIYAVGALEKETGPNPRVKAALEEILNRPDCPSDLQYPLRKLLSER